jgi:methyl-accepting chemotaxis protein
VNVQSRTWTFGRKLALGFGLALSLLLVIGFVSFRGTDALIENDHAVTHTHAVLEGTAHVLSLLKDAETGQRGYLLTGDESYLEPYTTAVAAVAGELGHVRSLTSDNPRQQARLDQLDPLTRDKLAELKETIELRRAQGFDAALKVVTSGRGKKAMDDIRRLLGEIDGEERELLRARSESAEASARAAKTTILFGSAGAFILVVLAAFVITRSLNNQLAAAISSMQSSSAELQAAATQQASGSREQSSAATEVSTTIRELLATSHQIAESSQRVSRIADETAAGARDGEQTVLRGHEAMQTIKRQVDVIVGHMLELGRKSQQAGGILEVVNELSEQTNILAINATIEAAGAGEHGRRFSVVADEIRKLADRVGGSTKEIRTLIEDIRSSVNTTVMATESGTKAVDAGARQFVDVTSSFKHIAGLVGTTTDAAREIELSTKQQASAVEQVNVAITSVAQATKETEASSAQTLQTATQLVALSHDLLRLIQPDAG